MEEEVQCVYMDNKDDNNIISNLNYDNSIIKRIREDIEKMNKFNQIEILRILYSIKSIVLNENNYGVFVNLTNLDNQTLFKLEKYIMYVNQQENELDSVEKQKKEYIDVYFKDIK